ncbi:MAG: SRPBCC domain-containing protein [Flavisolibacter sp.]
MNSHDWSKFLLRIPIAAHKQNIFDRWTSQSALESWFLRQALFYRNGKALDPQTIVRVNDSYEWRWYGYPDEVTEKGSILEMQNDKMKFSFGKAGNVTVSIKEEQGQNILELLQDEIPTDQDSQFEFHIGCSKGWVYHLTNLKSILEGGMNLTNRNMELKDVINS